MISMQPLVSLAQTAVPQPPIKKKRIKPIHSELSLGARLNTDGWSFFIDKAWVKSEDRKRDLFYDVKLLQIEISEKKHPMQKKGTNNLGPTGTDGAKPFIYGKINNFYTLKIGYGRRKMIAGKPDPGSVSIHLVYLAGLSIGFQKPYYIETVAPQGNGGVIQESISYSDSTKDKFLSRPFIVGSSGFSKGFSDLKIVPGIHAKTGLHFDFAATRTTKLAIETGVGIEYYFSEVPLMANQKANALFGNLYVSFQLGKRWPKKK